MSIKQLLTQGTVVGLPVGNALTNDGIITALDLESLLFIGLTFGAWFKILMFISLCIIILINLTKLCRELKKMYRGIHKLCTKKGTN